MRQAGSIPDHDQAQRFVDHLLTQGITAKLDQAGDGWAIWVRDEDQLPQAVKELEAFVSGPDAARYRQARSSAESLRKQQHAEDSDRRKNFIEMRDRWDMRAIGRRPLTIVLIVISVLVAIATDAGEKRDSQVLRWLWFARLDAPNRTPTRSIEEGQVWRLVTPIFIHFGLPHLVFNMYWLYLFGSLIETRKGTIRFGLLVLVVAAISNYSQYYFPYHFSWAGEPSLAFGGMSGVGYGLFGYLWMKSRFEPQSQFYLPPNTVVLFLVWFVLCITGIFGPIANWAHGTGLVTGAAIGYAPTAWRKLTGR